jgi:hypothetical protein
MERAKKERATDHLVVFPSQKKRIDTLCRTYGTQADVMAVLLVTYDAARKEAKEAGA